MADAATFGDVSGCHGVRRVVAVAFATVVVACAAASAGETPKQPVAPRRAPAPTTALEGIVKGSDGKPIERALVLAEPSEGQSMSDARELIARTDASGRFRIAVARAVPHDLRIDAKGWAMATVDRAAPGSPIRVTLDKGGVIEGLVKETASGAPVADARVEAWTGGSIRVLVNEPGLGVVRGVTDAKGRFRLEGVGQGSFTVIAQAPGMGRAREGDVRPGAKIDLLLIAGAGVRGVVTGSAGRPAEGALVHVEGERRTGLRRPPERTDTKGRFEFVGLDSGRYRLIAQHKELGLAVTQDIVLEKGEDASVDLRLAPGTPVIGRLVTAKGGPLAGVVSVSRLDGRAALWTLEPPLQSLAAENGRFRLDRVPSGAVTLTVEVAGRIPKTVDVGVSEGARQVDVGDVVLEDGASIRGRVSDRRGAPVAGARVAVQSTALWDDRVTAQVETQADGSFVFAGLKDVPFTLHVRASGFAAARREVTAPSEDVNVILEPGGSITGVVVDDQGRAVQSYAVYAEQADGDPSSLNEGRFDHVSDADGRFTLRDVEAGKYALAVEATGLSRGTVADVRVTAGATVDVGRIKLARGGSIRGLVIDAGGAGIGGAAVRISDDSFWDSAATSDAAGAFEIHGVAAGTFTVTATHRDYSRGQQSDVVVDPAGGPPDVRIVLTQGGRVAGWARHRDGRPVAGAEVRVSAEGSFVGSSDLRGSVEPDGAFAIDHVPAGRTRVVLMRPSGRALQGSISQSVDVREGETATVDLVVREILVHGRVTRRGAPLPNARVAVRMGWNMLRVGGEGALVTDTKGPQRFRATTRADGSYELLVDGPGPASLHVDRGDGRTTLQYRTVEIADADQQEIDFDIGGASVSGIVVEKATDRGVPRASVAAASKPPDQGENSSATADSEGRFQLELAPGRYVLSASAQGFASGAVLDLDVGDAGLSDVKIALETGQSISGRLLDAAGRPAGDVEIWISSSSGGGGASTTRVDGSFAVSGLSAGPHTVVALSDARGYALRLGVPAGADDVILRLRPMGTIHARVFAPDGSPAAGILVGVESVAGAPAFVGKYVPTNAQGFADVRAPAEIISVLASGTRMTGRALATVAPGQTVAVEIRLAPETER